jgi:hypothetical protein
LHNIYCAINIASVGAHLAIIYSATAAVPFLQNLTLGKHLIRNEDVATALDTTTHSMYEVSQMGSVSSSLEVVVCF